MPKTAKMIAESLSITDENDIYHCSILAGAKALVVDGKGHYRYLTQYASYRCLWESEPCRADTDKTRETLYTTKDGEIIGEGYVSI